MADYPTPPGDYPFVGAPLPAVISERHFLYGDAPHPRTVAHTGAVVERIQALKPPSLVKLDRGEQVIAAAVALWNLEQHGQGIGDEQWHKAREYLSSLTERYVEATT